MADKRDGVERGGDDQFAQPDPHDTQSYYEHPALDAKPGFWDGKWTEFKRLFGARMEEQGCALIVIGVALIVVMICATIFGWR